MPDSCAAGRRNFRTDARNRLKGVSIMRCIGCGVKTRGTWEGHTWLALCENCNDRQSTAQPMIRRRPADVRPAGMVRIASQTGGRGARAPG